MDLSLKEDKPKLNDIRQFIMQLLGVFLNFQRCWEHLEQI